MRVILLSAFALALFAASLPPASAGADEVEEILAEGVPVCNASLDGCSLSPEVWKTIDRLLSAEPDLTIG